jgi:TonB family protein
MGRRYPFMLRLALLRARLSPRLRVFWARRRASLRTLVRPLVMGIAWLWERITSPLRAAWAGLRKAIRSNPVVVRIVALWNGMVAWRRGVREGRWPLTLGNANLLPERYLQAPEGSAWEPALGPDPALEVPWAAPWEGWLDNVRVLREPLPALPEDATEPAFRDADVRLRQSRQRELLVSVALHVLFLSLPVPEFLTRPPAYKPTFTTVRIEYDLRWTGTSPVLPPISPTRRPERKPGPGGQEGQPLPPPGADIVSPQVIVSNPPQPNHPTQTLLQQFGLEKSRVQAPDVRLPNMVIPPSADAAPTAQVDLKRMRVPDAPLDLTGPPRSGLPPRPKSRAELAMQEMPLENLMPRLTLPTSAGGEGSTGTAPEVNAPMGVPRSGDLATPGVIALSANPAAPGPVLRLPDTNLRARFTAGPVAGRGSPGGVPGGVPGASGGSGGGPGGEGGGPGGLAAPDILVTPGGPVPPGPVIVGVERPPGAAVPPPPPPARTAAASAAPQPSEAQRGRQEDARSEQASPSKSAQQRARELLEAARAGSQSRRRVDTTYAFIPALTSQSSTWMLRYAERDPGSPGRVATAGISANSPRKNPDLVPPRAMKKVDPCYPSDAYRERVDGTVVLYGVIRADGVVEDATLVEGIEPRVDTRAVRAFAQSVFEPARKKGQPIEVEVLVEIPFRLAPCL